MKFTTKQSKGNTRDLVAPDLIWIRSSFRLLLSCALLPPHMPGWNDSFQYRGHTGHTGLTKWVDDDVYWRARRQAEIIIDNKIRRSGEDYDTNYKAIAFNRVISENELSRLPKGLYQHSIVYKPNKGRGPMQAYSRFTIPKELAHSAYRLRKDFFNEHFPVQSGLGGQFIPSGTDFRYAEQ